MDLRLVMLRISERESWFAIFHLDHCGSHIHSLPQRNGIVNYKFLSNAYTFHPYWHSLNNNATTCVLATYTHPFRGLTQKDVHVSPLSSRLPHPNQNISSIIVCFSLWQCQLQIDLSNDTRGQHIQFSVSSTVRFAAWCSCAQLTH